MENQTMGLQSQGKTASGLSSVQAKEVELPIKSCQEDVLRKAIGYGIMLAGLTVNNMPSKIEMAFLSQFIRNNYPDYTPDEIRYAIEKAMARKYGFEVDVKCYGNFSAEYVGRILEAYETWSKERDTRFYAYQYEFEPNEMRYSTQLLFEQYLAGDIREEYDQKIYWQFVYDGYIKPLPGRQAYRMFPKQIEIKRVFQTAAGRGWKALYVLNKAIGSIEKVVSE